MAYRVLIRRNSDGVERWYKYDFPYEEHHDFLWSEGNYSCDCNRAIFFAQAGKEAEPVDPPCGDNAFTILNIVNEDGTETGFIPEEIP